MMHSNSENHKVGATFQGDVKEPVEKVYDKALRWKSRLQ